MTDLPVLQLRPRADARLRGGHVWVYSNEVDVEKTPLTGFAAGSLAQLRDANDRPLGVVYVNARSLICARLLSRRADARIDTAFLRSRIARARDWRDSVYAQPFYRLIYGEGDGLPGLVVDRFGGVLVVQIGSAGMEALKQPLIEALVAELQPEGILLRNTSGVRELEGLETCTELAHGQVPEQVTLQENGVSFLAPVWQGQKTGWFYDHREGRAALMPWLQGKRVLDVFSYVGAWGVQALVAGGAAEAVLVDSSEAALTLAHENATRNGVADRLTTVEGQAADVLRELINAGERFDAVIVDPPAFIKRRKDLPKGSQAYRKVNELAMRLLSRDGLLVSASSSLHLSSEALTETVRAAARHVDREARIVARHGLGADHPVPAAIPETDYLKTVFSRITMVD